MHLIIDGYGGNPQSMQDVNLVYQLLDSYPDKIGMVKLAPPKVSKYVGPKPQDGGISAFVGLAESHISIHTFLQQSYVSIDIFSCKKFDAEQAVRDFRDKLGLTKVKTYVIDRPKPALGRAEGHD